MAKQQNNNAMQHQLPSSGKSDDNDTISTRSNSGNSLHELPASSSAQTPSSSRPAPPTIKPAPKTSMARQQSSVDDSSLNERVELIRREYESRKPPPPPPQVAKVMTMATAQLKAGGSIINRHINMAMTVQVSSSVSAESSDDSSSEEEDSTDGAITPIKVRI